MSKETVETYANALEKFNEKEKKIENFNEMLLSIKDLDDKRRILWQEIYNNATTDRENASILFTDTLMQVRGNASNHNN